MSVELTPADTATTSPTVPDEPGAVLEPLPLRTLLIMSAACGASAGNIYLNQPLLNTLAQQFNATSSQASLVATATQVGYGVGILFFVPLGDLHERRKLVLTLTYLCVLTMVASALATSLWFLILTQLLLGMTAMSAQLLIPLAVDMSPPQVRGRTVGMLMAGLLCGLLVGRSFAGYVGDHHGWRTVFWAAATFLFLTGIVLQMTLPHRAPALKMSYGRLMHSMFDLIKAHRTLRVASFVSATSFGAFVAFWTVLSFLMQERLGRGPTAAGMLGIVGLVGAIAAPMAGRLSDKKGHAFTLTIAMILTMVSFVQMWAWVSIAGLIVGVLLLDLGAQSVQVAAQSEVMALDPLARSRLNTIYMVARFIGGAAGSAIGAVAWSHSGWTGTCVAALVALGIGTIVHLIGTRNPEQPVSLVA